MKILIISEYIAPVNEIAAIRWTKLGKYLNKNKDCDVDILTIEKDFNGDALHAARYTYDDTLAPDLEYFDHVYEISSSALRAINFVHNKAKQLFAPQEPTLPSNSNSCSNDTDEEHESIMDKMLHQYEIILNNSERRAAINSSIKWIDYDTIISTYSPFWPHQVAYSIKKKHPNIIWVADYRDSLSPSNEGLTDYDKNFISKTAQYATCILSVSKGVEKCVLPQRSLTPSCVLPNGFDDEELTSRTRKKYDKFVLSYTGTLYNIDNATSDLTPLFQAVEDLIIQNIIDPSDIEVAYCGNSENEFITQVSPFTNINWTNKGLIPRSEALEIQEKSSLLILSTWNTKESQGIVTGKVFEYLTSHVPIVCLCSGDVPNAELSKIVKDSNAGFAYEESKNKKDYPALVEFIKNEYLEWKTTGMTICETNDSYISQYSYSELADRLYKTICELS